MRVISVPTEKFRNQNPIFHQFYGAMRARGVEVSDIRFSDLFARDLAVMQVHFPEHFAMNYAMMPAFVRCCSLLAAVLICKARGVPVLWTVHNVAPFDRRNMTLYKLLMAAFVPLVDGCIFLSRSSQQEFHRAYPAAKPRSVAFIPHPAYPVQVGPAPDGEAVMLGMLGEQKAYKRPMEGLRLFETALQVVDARLHVAGEVHDPGEFAAALLRLPPGRATWINRRLEDEELEHAAGGVNFALLPYGMTTNSGAAIFALSCERPIVASSLPLFLELREIFGPQWVRIADGAEANASFWMKPTDGDRADLRAKLNEISLGAIVQRHLDFFESVQPRRARRLAGDPA
jgi:beta-1,4-mannosyltransferase